MSLRCPLGVPEGRGAFHKVLLILPALPTCSVPVVCRGCSRHHARAPSQQQSCSEDGSPMGRPPAEVQVLGGRARPPGTSSPGLGLGVSVQVGSCWGVGALLATSCAGDFPTSGSGPRPGEQTLTHISTAPGGKQATVRLEPGLPAARLWTQNFQAGKWVSRGEKPRRAGVGSGDCLTEPRAPCSPLTTWRPLPTRAGPGAPIWGCPQV